MDRRRPLAGTRIAITRPAGTGRALARRVRALGGTPLSLPGSSLRAPRDAKATRTELRAALASEVVIFTSPAAVQFARRLGKLHGRACVVAPGSGTLDALRRAGCTNAIAPGREDSEGILALPVLQNVRGRRIGIVGATGGRGLLDRELAARSARVLHAYVYRRLPARLDRRHADALRRDTRKPLFVLLSSAEALANILGGLPDDANRALLAGTAIVSSPRLATAARKAGFARVLHAESAHADALLAAVVADTSMLHSKRLL
ncbi:MAG: uroporphyrinogen-III synthase [Rhodanobacteraceae bacterium]|nr:MAG: uroporphyrinogen-III synthase [Rhodanobacteraceae bacterium]